MTNPKYPLTGQEARIALMTEPPGTIIEDINGNAFKIDELYECLSQKKNRHRKWELSSGLPNVHDSYRVIPLPAPEPAPHVNPTMDECMRARSVWVEWPASWCMAPNVTSAVSRPYTSFEYTFVRTALADGLKVEVIE